MKNSRLLLFLLGIGMVFSFYYAWQNMPHERHLDNDKSEIAVTIDSPAGDTAESDRFDFSGGEQRKFKKPRRNLFNQLFPPPPAPAPKKVVAPPVAPPAPVVVVPAPAPPPAPVTVRSYMPSFQVLGFLEKSDQLTAFVSLQGEIYLVKKEQVFAGEFQVVELNHEKITIARTSGVGKVSLPLSGKADSTSISGGPVRGSSRRPGVPTARRGSRPRILESRQDVPESLQEMPESLQEMPESLQEVPVPQQEMPENTPALDGAGAN